MVFLVIFVLLHVQTKIIFTEIKIVFTKDILFLGGCCLQDFFFPVSARRFVFWVSWLLLCRPGSEVADFQEFRCFGPCFAAGTGQNRPSFFELLVAMKRGLRCRYRLQKSGEFQIRNQQFLRIFRRIFWVLEGVEDSLAVSGGSRRRDRLFGLCRWDWFGSFFWLKSFFSTFWKFVFVFKLLFKLGKLIFDRLFANWAVLYSTQAQRHHLTSTTWPSRWWGCFEAIKAPAAGNYHVKSSTIAHPLKASGRSCVQILCVWNFMVPLCVCGFRKRWEMVWLLMRRD